MNILKMINKVIKKIEELIIAYAIIFITLILVVNVFTRQFMDYSWKAAEETSIFLIVAITFMSVSYAARMGKHITMTIALDFVPHRVKKIMMIANSILSVIALLFVAKISWDYVMYVKEMGRITSALSIPAWWTIVIMPIGFLLSAIQFALAFILNIRNKNQVYIGPERIYGTVDTDEVTL